MLGKIKQLEEWSPTSNHTGLNGLPDMTRSLSSMGIVVNALWLSVIVAAGFSAILTFKTVPELEPMVAEYDLIDQTTRSRIVAGLITGPGFQMADLLQWILAPLLIAIIVTQRIANPQAHRNILSWISTLAVLTATAIFVSRYLWLNPTMNAELEIYRTAARAGDPEQIQTTYTAFDRWHVLAENLWSLVGLLLLISLACMGAMACPRSKGG
tara:strand:+ start:126 stop:761 length:636 start_codon:yes stop_codon:yes gene_type:complete